MPITAARPTLPRAGLFAGIAVAGVLLLVLLLRSASDPPRVAALTVANPSPYQVSVEVSPAGEERWLDLGAVDRERDRTIEELPDLGTRWVFRFASGGVEGGRVEVARTVLRDAGWKITVPPDVVERFEAAGLRPSAG
jgi:hypothetical protein